MRIETDITQEDWKAFSGFLGRKSWKRCFPLAMFIPAGIAIATGLAFRGFGVELHAASYFAGIAVGVMLLMSVPQLLARQMRPAENGIILGPQEVELTETGLRVVSRWSEGVFRWDAVRGAEVTDKHIFVMVDRNAGIIVPRRSFATDAEREQFVSEIQGRSRGLAI